MGVLIERARYRVPLARAKAQFAVHQRVAAQLEGLQLLSLRPRFERPGEKDAGAAEGRAEVRLGRERREKQAGRRGEGGQKESGGIVLRVGSCSFESGTLATRPRRCSTFLDRRCFLSLL